MLRDILAGGNFGEKDLDRLNQSKLLRDNESRRVGRGHNFTNAIRFLNQRARERVPASRKLPILLPIGWAAVYRRHKNAVRTGLQAPVHLRRTLDSARERQSIYEQLRLFEPSPEQPEKSSEHQAK